MPGLWRLVRDGPSDALGRFVDVLGRIGLLGYGVVHLLVAWLAVQVTIGVPDAPADAQGAASPTQPPSRLTIGLSTLL